MFRKSLYTALLLAAFSHAAVQELIPQLTSDDLEVQSRAQLDLLAVCSEAGAPDAPQGARKAVCLEICTILEDPEQPVLSVIQPMLNNLERIGGEESVSTLAGLLDIRDDARRALAANPSAAAGAVLSGRLAKDTGRSPRMTAGLISALGERREAGSSELISPFLSSKDDRLYVAAVRALGRLNEEAGIRALANERTRAKGFRQIQVYAALFSTDRRVVFEKLYAENEPDEVRAAALLGLTMSGGTRTAAEAMKSRNSVLQAAVIEGALQSGEEDLYALIARHLDQLEPHVQLRALTALEVSNSREHAKAVEPLLEADDRAVQDGAAAALGRIGTASSVPALLDNGSPAARRALGLLNVAGVDKALEQQAGKSAEAGRRSVAIEALSMRGRRDLVPLFFEYAAEDNGDASRAAAAAIGRLGDHSSVDPLTALMVEMEATPVARELLTALVEIIRHTSEPGKAVEVLVNHMEGASPRSQANILQALVRTEREEALKPLSDACRSNDAQLQKTAVKLMSGWQNKNALPTMIELASDESMSMAHHVTMMRGISRLLADERRPKPEWVAGALEACRRDEERQMIQEVMDQKR
jgi:HEAT repeat protein